MVFYMYPDDMLVKQINHAAGKGFCLWFSNRQKAPETVSTDPEPESWQARSTCDSDDKIRWERSVCLIFNEWQEGNYAFFSGFKQRMNVTLMLHRRLFSISALWHVRLLHEGLGVVRSYVIRWCFRRLTEAEASTAGGHARGMALAYS